MIVSMKKAKIVVLNEDKEALLKSLQKSGELMIISQHEEQETFDTSNEDIMLQKTEKSLKIISQYNNKKSLNKTNHKQLDYEEFYNVDCEHKKLVEDIDNKSNEISKVKLENEALSNQMQTLLPWQELDIKLSELVDTKLTKVKLGFVLSKNIDMLVEKVEEQGAIMKVLGTLKDQSSILIIYLFENESAILNILKGNNYLEASLGNEDLLVIDKIELLKTQIESNNLKIENLHNDLIKLSEKESDLELLSDQMVAKRDLKVVSNYQTINTFYIEGWVREDKVKVLEKAIKDVVEIYDFELVDPEDGEIPPTYTKNNALVRPFEAITDMFSKPLPHELDPNPAMSFWYWILFGIMMGDAGYGIVMIILGLLILKYKKPTEGAAKLFKIIIYCGFSTIFWGIVFGSYFSAENFKPFGLEPLLEPIKQPIEMLILSFAIGVLHILTGLLMKTISLIRDKQYMSALFDQISWILIIVGIVLFILPQTKNIGIAMALTGTAIIIVTGGRSKPSPFGKAIGGLGTLYGIVNYFSDILSYSRLLALGLSTAIIAMVMNTIAGMLHGSVIGMGFAIIIYFVGHAFNLVMGLLSAYVHDSRLQYVEYFGKFFEGGGYNFEPLSVQSKFIKKTN